MAEPKKHVVFPKQTVKCPECGTETEIFGENSGPCSNCGVDVEAVYRHAHYQKLARKVAGDPEPEPTPKPGRQPKKGDLPFW
jgi:tRNA(Ile2) C34 agmatinyltransferase TiaS